MEMIDRIFGKNKEKTKVKQKKVRRKDIEDNIRRIAEKMKKTEEGSDEYERLSKELEHEYVVLRKYMDARFYIEPQEWLKIGGVTAVLALFLCLEREVPAATKFASMALKMFPFKG